MHEPSSSSLPDASSRGLHLDSWKEIAAYLKRDIRTVQRWEKQEGLPVYRHQHDERGTAYAYSAEIDRWLETRSQRRNGADTPAVRAGAAATAAVSAPELAAHEREPASAGMRRGSASPWRLTPTQFAVAGLAIAAGAAALWATRPSPEPSRPLSSLSVVFPASERFREWGPELALSPDGSTVAYSNWSGRLRLRRLDQLEGYDVPGVEVRAWAPFFSPDGSAAAFFAAGGPLMRVPLTGGAPRVIATIEHPVVAAGDWGTHDEIVYATTTSDGAHGLYRVPAAGGQPQLIAALDSSAEIAFWLTPQWLDEGRTVLSTVARVQPHGTRFQAVAVSVATGEQRLLVDDARHAREIGGGRLVYWRDGMLFAAAFDSKRLQVHGPHVAAWEHVDSRVRNRSWAHATDTLVYWPGGRPARQAVWVDRHGREEPLALAPAEYHNPRVSPDGRSVAVIIGGGTDFGNLWRHDLATGATVQISHGNRSAAALWAPDGEHLVVSMQDGGTNALYRLRADGMGDPERIAETSGPAAATLKQPVGWLHDRQRLVVREGRLNEPRFWEVAPDGSLWRPMSMGTGRPSEAHVSPDGRWIAYVQENDVYAAPLPEGRPQWRVASGRLPVWARSGRELFYWSGRRMMVVPVTTNGTMVPGTPQMLFEGDYFEMGTGEPHYDVSPDAEHLLLLRRVGTEGPGRLNVIQGWRSEVERRLRDAR